MGDLKNIPISEIREAVAKSSNYTEVFVHLGYKEGYRSGSQLRWLKKKILDFNIDTSHMTFKREYNRVQSGNVNRKLEDIFCLDSKYPFSKRRDIIIKNNLINYECAICGNRGEWMGNELTLTLDHINGNHNDNRLENLRFLCPNCDHQQSTFGSKNKRRYMGNSSTKRKKACLICGNPVEKTYAKLCNKCFSERQWLSSNAPSKEQLIEDMVKLRAFTLIGNKYGVSDNAVRKWCIHYNLPSKSRDIRYNNWLDKVNKSP